MTGPRPLVVVPCAGCLGARECWVCLGSGAADTQSGVGACGSCGGSRRCRYCEDDDGEDDAPPGRPAPSA